MNVLLDTNVLCRMAQSGHACHQAAVDATAAVALRGDTPCLVPQVVYEFWVVATRPVAVNGLGLSVAEAAAELARVKSLFPLLPDTAAVFPAWESLVTSHAVAGKNAHDARLVAAMMVHGLKEIVTFNAADFGRYAGVKAVDPQILATSRPPPTP